MRASTIHIAAAVTALLGLANAERGAATVYGCLWLPNRITQPFDVQWTAGSSSDGCMVNPGHDATMKVSEAGLKCADLGIVELDESWGSGCKFYTSRWGLSYKTLNGPSYSGSADTQWKTGPWNTEIILKDSSPGTNVCSTESTCKRSSFEWKHATNAKAYIVFQPLAVAMTAEQISLEL